MARSQLLKDIVSGNYSIENILLRLKIIFSDLDSESITQWVDGELEGFKDQPEALPQYRVLKGNPIGTYMVNQSFQYKNAHVPLSALISEERINQVITMHQTDSITAIQNILDGENRENLVKIINTELCHLISTEDLQIAGMNVIFGSNQLDGIVSKVKSKLVEIVMELEKQFEDLDELDIEDQVKDDTNKRDKVVYNIETIIYDGSLSVGDKNRLGKSKIGHFFGGGKK